MTDRKIWTVYHDFEDEDFCEHFKVIGFFRNREQARDVVRRLKTKPGFSEHPKGFFIGRSSLNNPAWEEGFVSMCGVVVQPEPEVASDLPTVLDNATAPSDDSLWHVQHAYVDQWGCTETKPIGLFSDPELARQAVRDLMTQPGFRSRQSGFLIEPITLGRVFYEEGF